MKLILTINKKLELAKVINRPSKECKTPYVGDMIVDNKIEMVHCPSLGCCGYVDKEEEVYVNSCDNPKKCKYICQLALRKEKYNKFLVGVNPKMAEKIVHQCLLQNIIQGLNNINSIKPEQTYLNSRFDFVCKDENNTEIIIEVKSVPCADYEDIESKYRKNKDYSDRDIFSKVAYFPDGYRKKKVDVISPRALKHIQELEKLKLEKPERRTILIFVIQRIDCSSFQASIIDPLYKETLNKAYDNGVEIIPIQVMWKINGNCYFNKILPYNK